MECDDNLYVLEGDSTHSSGIYFDVGNGSNVKTKM